MNLLLHGIGIPTGESLIEVKDALIADPGRRYSVVLSNPPFGRKSSLTMIGADGREAREEREIERQDFVVTTANKQLNFLQHIATLLDINGRAAVVLPDNVLFEGGAGETLRRRMLRDFDLHTMLRLPTGIFYAQGVKANVLFFDKKPASERPWTERLWIYDLRTNQHFTLKQNPLRRHHLEDFVSCFAPGKPRSDRVETERFKALGYDELVARDKVNLDITWLRDDSLEDMENLPPPEVIAREIVEDLTAALAEFEAMATALESSAKSAGNRESV
jgi:type I restriction enzyme M protein